MLLVLPQVSVLHQYWVAIPLPGQGPPVDVHHLVQTVRANVPPGRASLTCTIGPQARHCANQPVPARLERTAGLLLHYCFPWS